MSRSLPVVLPPLPSPVDVPLVELPEHPCPYLTDRVAKNRALLADGMPAEMYRRFMDAGFRRSGRIVYQPICATCRACVPIRVPVATFAPTKSQRRCARRNADLAVTVARPEPTAEKFELYRRYVAERHREQDASIESFIEFLYTSPIDTIELTYRAHDGRLLAVGLCDVSASSLSSVYFYFDPSESRRGLGTFGVLTEIEHAGSCGIPYYYLGYWIEGCRAMRYKKDFVPSELLHPDGVWR